MLAYLFGEGEQVFEVSIISKGEPMEKSHTNGDSLLADGMVDS